VDIGAVVDEFAPVPYLRFDETAQGIFGEWRQDSETSLRSGEMTPALESHFAKYRKLVPSLALINHLADGGNGAVGEAAILGRWPSRSIRTHARRVYGAGAEFATATGKALLKRMRSGDLADRFTGRDVQIKG
jgi:hypothetical protein